MSIPNDDCPHCHGRDTVQRPHPAWRIAVVASWLVCTTTVVFASLIGPFITVLGPIILFSGASLLGYVHGKASQEPQCSECGKLAYPIEDTAVARFARRTTVDLAA